MSTVIARVRRATAGTPHQDGDVPPSRTGALIDDATVDKTADSARISGSYLLYMATSGVLASVALLSSSVPILIGSMVVAPLMPPLALVPFALVMHRRGEAVRGLRVALAGLAVAFVTAWLTTVVMTAAGVTGAGADLLTRPLLEERVEPGWWSLAAAVAAGLAGTIAHAHEKTDALIGTVAALALVPAAGAAAIALHVGAFDAAAGAALLLAMNIALIIAMGITAVLASAGRDGLRPLAFVPVLTVAVVAGLLVWAQSTGTVPRMPGNFQSTPGDQQAGSP